MREWQHGGGLQRSASYSYWWGVQYCTASRDGNSHHRAARYRRSCANSRACAEHARRRTHTGAQSWTMPNLVGSNLQDAQDAIQKLTNNEISTRVQPTSPGKAATRSWTPTGRSARRHRRLGRRSLRTR